MAGTPPSGLGRDLPVRVLVATPLGRGGKGGIDRIMDDVRRQFASVPPENLDVVFLTTRGKHHVALSALFLAVAIIRFGAARAAGRADILHVNLSSHGSTSRKLVLCETARVLGVPYLLHLHGSRFRQYWTEASSAKSARIARMFEGAARILVLGRTWDKFVRERAPATGGRIEILPNASRSPSPRAKPMRDDVTILFLGRIGQRKGVPQLVEALAALAPEQGWHAVIAGDGTVEDTRAKVAALGLADRVFVPGWVGPDAAEELLASSDILVLPSFDENLPMSVIEGMAHGLAVVATPVGAIEDIISDGVTGLLTRPGDSGRLAAVLKRLILDAELRAALGERAAAYHRAHLDIAPYAAHLADIWREVGGRRSSAV